MAGDRKKTAGQAAKAKAERRGSDQEKEKGLTPGTVEPANLQPDPDDSSKPTEELRAEVEEARDELAETVEELSDRLDPRPKIDAAGDAARSAVLPAALGLGLLVALLVWLRRR